MKSTTSKTARKYANLADFGKCWLSEGYEKAVK